MTRKPLMTKRDLLKLLESVPDDALLVKPGHSDGEGYSDIFSIEAVSIIEEYTWKGKYAKSNQETSFVAYVIS